MSATEPGESAVPSAAEPGWLRRFLAQGGEIRPLVSGAIATALVVLILVLVVELAVVLLSLAGVSVFKHLLGSPLLSWLAHRIYL
jgi:hypothetical protein